MKYRIRPIVLSIVLPCLGSIPASGAQECKVRGLSLQTGAPAAAAKVFNEATTVAVGEVRIRTFLNHESDLLKFKDSTLVFSTHPDAAGAKDPETFIGTCEIPETLKSIILLFVPEAPEKPASKIYAIDDGAKLFPPGSTMVANLTTMPVKIVLETKEYGFAPGETRSITDQPVNENHSSGMTASTEKDQEWTTFSTGVWSHPGEKRVLQVITEDPDSGQVAIRGVRDVTTP